MSSSRENRRQLYEQLVGQTVANRYQIASLMGFGGMGAVYEAVDRNMQRRIALKYIPSHDPVATERFKREALTVSNLRHRNTVTVFDRGETSDGFLFLSMELLSGRTLTDLIKQESPLNPERVVHIASQICGSLGEAHESGIVHRDVKPDNIILIKDDGDPDFVKVLDFGIAKAVSREDDVTLTGDGRIIGTPRYMSPEQILGEEITPRSDIYSLGCIIFEMLCGAPPFRGGTTTALMISHAQDPPPPFAERLSEQALQQIPVGLEHVVRRAMSKRPSNRPQNTDELRRELEEALAAHRAGRPANVTAPAPELPATPPPTLQQMQNTGAGGSSQGSTLVIAIALLAVLISLTATAIVVLDGGGGDEPVDGDALAEAVPQPPPDAVAPSERTEEADEPEEESHRPTSVSVRDTIAIRLESDPDGATVSEGGQELGTTPFNLTVGPNTRTLEYSLSRSGYRDKDITVEIDPDGDDLQEFAFELERRRPTRVQRRPQPQPEEEQAPRRPAIELLSDDDDSGPFVPTL